MSVTTEQQVINQFYSDDNTKTISDVVNELNKIHITDSKSIEFLKQYFSNVSDWTI
tara:strand:+ start:78 stop:245 length:168 start_codon:yes stop_codon:yes gene_type:complete